MEGGVRDTVIVVNRGPERRATKQTPQGRGENRVAAQLSCRKRTPVGIYPPYPSDGSVRFKLHRLFLPERVGRRAAADLRIGATPLRAVLRSSSRCLGTHAGDLSRIADDGERSRAARIGPVRLNNMAQTFSCPLPSAPNRVPMTGMGAMVPAMSLPALTVAPDFPHPFSIMPATQAVLQLPPRSNARPDDRPPAPAPQAP